MNVFQQRRRTGAGSIEKVPGYSLKSAKNVVFFPFCILVDTPIEGALEPTLPPPPGCATDCNSIAFAQAITEKFRCKSIHIFEREFVLYNNRCDFA